MKPDARICFTLFPDSGRTSPIRGDKYGCPLLINGSHYDCRFVLPEVVDYKLGFNYEVDVKFFRPDLAVPELHKDLPIELWEGRPIGRGKILKIYTDFQKD